MKEGQITLPIWALLTITGTLFSWWVLYPSEGDLTTSLDSVLFPFDFLESQYAYLYAIMFSFFFPFLLSFDQKVHYVGYWKYLLAVFLWVSTIYVIWDIIFTDWKIWEFNADYISGIRIWGLPLEEVSFFIVVPFACIFIYECVYAYDLRKYLGLFSTWAMRLFFAFGIGLVLSANSGYYSISASLVLVFALVWLEWRHDSSEREEIYIMLLLSYVPFLFVNGVLTGCCTREPIVIYNDMQNLPWRVGSIPFDDALYQGGMMLWMIFVYLGAKKRKKKFYFF